MTDPISDMLTRIRNAQAVKKSEVVLALSKIKFNIAKILEKEGWVGEVKKQKINYGQIKVGLKYDKEGQPVIRSLKRISKPGLRVYVSKDKLPRVLNGMGIAIISTSHGLMTNKEARKKGMGGEILCEVY